MNYVINKISDEYDVVIRLRLDTEIKSFELFDNIKPNIYYTVIDDVAACSDNIGYSKLEVMKKVWDLKNCFIKAFNNETLVYNAILKNSYSIQQFNFDYILYQNNSEMFDDILQWSKNNRRWIYDGKTYTKGIILKKIGL
jgi:type IV secretory pathway VirB6-like protein